MLPVSRSLVRYMREGGLTMILDWEGSGTRGETGAAGPSVDRRDRRDQESAAPQSSGGRREGETGDGARDAGLMGRTSHSVFWLEESVDRFMLFFSCTSLTSSSHSHTQRLSLCLQSVTLCLTFPHTVTTVAEGRQFLTPLSFHSPLSFLTFESTSSETRE